MYSQFFGTKPGYEAVVWSWLLHPALFGISNSFQARGSKCLLWLLCVYHCMHTGLVHFAGIELDSHNCYASTICRAHTCMCVCVHAHTHPHFALQLWSPQDQIIKFRSIHSTPVFCCWTKSNGQTILCYLCAYF